MKGSKVVILALVLVIPIALSPQTMAQQMESYETTGSVGMGSPTPMATFEGGIYKFTHWYFIDVVLHYSFYNVPFKGFLIGGEFKGYVLFNILGRNTFPVEGTGYLMNGIFSITWSCLGYSGWATGAYE